MKIVLDIDLTNRRIFVEDELGNKDDLTDEGHDFWEVCPSHISSALDMFIDEHWGSYVALIQNPEYERLEKQYNELLRERTLLQLKIMDLEKNTVGQEKEDD